MARKEAHATQIGQPSANLRRDARRCDWRQAHAEWCETPLERPAAMSERHAACLERRAEFSDFARKPVWESDGLVCLACRPIGSDNRTWRLERSRL